MFGKSLVCLAVFFLCVVFAEQDARKYLYSTNYKTKHGNEITLQATVFISEKISEIQIQNGKLYSMLMEDVKIEENGVVSPVFGFDKNFLFFQSPTGQIDFIKASPSETLEVKNIKKGVVDAFQMYLQNDMVEEIGGNGKRYTRYEVKEEKGQINIAASYSKSSFIEFPKHSNLENFNGHIHGTKQVIVDSNTLSVLESQTKISVSTFDKMKSLTFFTQTTLTFDSIVEKELRFDGEFVEESLIHEIDPKAKYEELKSLHPSFNVLVSKFLVTGSVETQRTLSRLMNYDQNAAEEILHLLSQKLQKETVFDSHPIFKLLASTQDSLAQELLAKQFEIAASAENIEDLEKFFRSLTLLKNPSSPMTLVNSMMSTKVPKAAQNQLDLSISHVCKFLKKSEAQNILSHFADKLAVAQTPAEKVQLLYVLGNAGDNTPVSVIIPFLKDSDSNVRSVALVNLKNQLSFSEVQEAISTMLERSIRQTENVAVTLAHTLQQGLRKKSFMASSISEKLFESLQKVSEILNENDDEELQLANEFISKLLSAKLTGKTEVWNDTSDPLYDLVAPASQRQDDVNKFSDYNAFLSVRQIGPRFANLKVAVGVFSGAGGSGCLTGDFKIFDKLYVDTELFGEQNVLADLQLYILNFDHKFDSRIYAIINGNTLVDFTISNNCTDDFLPIYDGEIVLIDYEHEFPVDIGNLIFHSYIVAGLQFEAEYEICLLSFEPFAELSLVGKVELIGDTALTLTVIGIIRGGLEIPLYINYEIGPSTQLGSKNNTSGDLVCQACIGVYDGYDAQFVSIQLFFQKREGLGWGDKSVVSLWNWEEPALPFPSPIIETCADL